MPRSQDFEDLKVKGLKTLLGNDYIVCQVCHIKPPNVLSPFLKTLDEDTQISQHFSISLFCGVGAWVSMAMQANLLDAIFGSR